MDSRVVFIYEEQNPGALNYPVARRRVKVPAFVSLGNYPGNSSCTSRNLLRNGDT
jgi:hypothetical protein